MRFSVIAAAMSVAASATIAAQTPHTQHTHTTETSRAGASLKDAEGRTIGEARLQQATNGVLLTLELTNATPGVHALHIHQIGVCEPPAFTSAGSHFAPGGSQHGFLNPHGPHAGDLPNIHVPSSRELKFQYLIPDVTLEAGPQSLFDADGSAIVLHAGEDDYQTDPAGNAGDRLACGVIENEG